MKKQKSWRAWRLKGEGGFLKLILSLMVMVQEGENRVKERRKRVEKDMINNSKATHTQRCFFFQGEVRKNGGGERKRWRMMKEGKNKIKEKRDAMAGGRCDRPIRMKLSQTSNILKGGWESLCSLYVVAARISPLSTVVFPLPLLHMRPLASAP